MFLSGWPNAMISKSFVDAYKEHMFYIGYNLSPTVHLPNFGHLGSDPNSMIPGPQPDKKTAKEQKLYVKIKRNADLPACTSTQRGGRSG
jgi:hypothetical protein